MPTRTEIKVVDDDIETITSDIIKDYEARTGKVLQPAHIERLIINTFAYREMLLRKQVNEAYRQQHIRYATGLMLDVAGDDFGTPRLQATAATVTLQFTREKDYPQTVHIDAGTQVAVGNLTFSTTDAIALTDDIPVNVTAVCDTVGEVGNGYQIGQISRLIKPMRATVRNINASSHGSDIENDEKYRERILLAFERFSNAGPKDAYAYHARRVSPQIIDVHVDNARTTDGRAIGGTVVVSLFTRTMPPSSALISQVTAALNDQKVRPLCDTVTVTAAKVIDYTLNAELTIFVGENADAIIAAAKMAFDAYITTQRARLGVDIVPLNIARALQVSGVYDVKLISPSHIIVPPDSVAVPKSISITVREQADG